MFARTGVAPDGSSLVDQGQVGPGAGAGQPDRESVLRHPRLRVIGHPLVAAQLTLLRSVETEAPRFRAALEEISGLLGYEALAGLPLVERDVTTPLEHATGYAVDAHVAIVPILRAGLAMVDGLLRLLPTARVWHLGLYRDEETLRPVPYYNRAMRADQVSQAVVVDPMLATGGSAHSAIELVRAVGVTAVTMIGVVAAPAGALRLLTAYPTLRIYVAALDRGLDEHGYIRPGLGDAGDRAFHTTG